MSEINKPNLEQVLKIIEMKEQAAELYKRIDAELAQIKDEFGAGRFDYETPNLEEPFLKFEVIDNLATMQAGGTVWASTAFKEVTFKSQGLKRKPESLKIS